MLMMFLVLLLQKKETQDGAKLPTTMFSSCTLLLLRVGSSRTGKRCGKQFRTEVWIEDAFEGERKEHPLGKVKEMRI